MSFPVRLSAWAISKRVLVVLPSSSSARSGVETLERLALLTKGGQYSTLPVRVRTAGVFVGVGLFVLAFVLWRIYRLSYGMDHLVRGSA